jgi:hypothetical protein
MNACILFCLSDVLIFIVLCCVQNTLQLNWTYIHGLFSTQEYSCWSPQHFSQSSVHFLKEFFCLDWISNSFFQMFISFHLSVDLIWMFQHTLSWMFRQLLSNHWNLSPFVFLLRQFPHFFPTFSLVLISNPSTLFVHFSP